MRGKLSRVFGLVRGSGSVRQVDSQVGTWA